MILARNMRTHCALCTGSTHTAFATSKDKQNAQFHHCLLISDCTKAAAPWDQAWKCLLPDLAQLLTCLYRTLIINIVFTGSLFYAPIALLKRWGVNQT